MFSSSLNPIQTKIIGDLLFEEFTSALLKVTVSSYGKVVILEKLVITF